MEPGSLNELRGSTQCEKNQSRKPLCNKIRTLYEEDPGAVNMLYEGILCLCVSDLNVSSGLQASMCIAESVNSLNVRSHFQRGVH